MTKKTLFGVVVLSVLFNMPVLAAEQSAGDEFDLKAHCWPGEKPTDLDFKTPVYMNFGLYFQISNSKDVVNDGIVIRQESMLTYTGCSIAMDIQTNFNMILSAKIERTALGEDLQDDSTKWTVEVRDQTCTVKQEEVAKTLSLFTEKRRIWVKLESPKQLESDFGKKKHVANVILTVKPNMEAIWVDP
jgi:hypothetical protein